MTFHRRGLAVVCVVGMALVSPPAWQADVAARQTAGATSSAGLVDAVLRAQLLDYLQQIRATNDLPGVTVAVGVGGHIVFSEGVGYAELDNHTPATGRPVLNAGSVSKVLAVVAVMQLAAQGKVNLDAEIQTYLPYYPKKEWPITVREILTHTSGTRHYNGTEFGEQDLLEKKHYDTFEEATRLWRDDPLLFKPGTMWYYSSHAMNLQQGIVEAASGTGFEAYMRRHVFDPAGMLATQFDVPWRVVVNRGRGYVRDRGGEFRNPPYADVSYKYAGGGMLTTSEDLVRLGMALNAGVLLAADTVKLMYTPQLAPDIEEYVPGGAPRPLNHKQALVWWIRTDAHGREYVSHTGTVKGTRSFVMNYVNAGVVVALQANTLPFDPVPVGEAIAARFLPPGY